MDNKIKKIFKKKYKLVKKKLLIFGSGAQSKLSYNIAKQTGDYNSIKIISFKESIKNNKKIIFLKKIENLKFYLDKNTYGLVALGDNFHRKELVTEINKKFKKFRWASIIAHNSNIGKNVRIGVGTIIMQSVFINDDTIIKNHCLINSKCLIEHDNKISSFASLSPNVTTGGNVSIGASSFLGIGTIIKNSIKIGSNTLIGAGSVIVSNCEKDSTYVGVPGKKISKRKRNTSFF